MNYFVKRDSTGYLVIEKATEHVVASFSKHDEAKNLSKRLNAGTGFDGWTPAFILQSTKNNFEKSKH